MPSSSSSSAPSEQNESWSRQSLFRQLNYIKKRKLGKGASEDVSGRRKWRRKAAGGDRKGGRSFEERDDEGAKNEVEEEEEAGEERERNKKQMKNYVGMEEGEEENDRERELSGDKITVKN